MTGILPIIPLNQKEHKSLNLSAKSSGRFSITQPGPSSLQSSTDVTTTKAKRVFKNSTASKKRPHPFSKPNATKSTYSTTDSSTTSPEISKTFQSLQEKYRMASTLKPWINFLMTNSHGLFPIAKYHQITNWHKKSISGIHDINTMADFVSGHIKSFEDILAVAMLLKTSEDDYEIPVDKPVKWLKEPVDDEDEPLSPMDDLPFKSTDADTISDPMNEFFTEEIEAMQQLIKNDRNKYKDLAAELYTSYTKMLERAVVILAQPSKESVNRLQKRVTSCLRLAKTHYRQLVDDFAMNTQLTVTAGNLHRETASLQKAMQNSDCTEIHLLSLLSGKTVAIEKTEEACKLWEKYRALFWQLRDARHQYLQSNLSALSVIQLSISRGLETIHKLSFL